MSFIGKQLQDITEADLMSLISDEVVEGKTIEFKVSLPGNSDDDKREFLADVSSFANAAGGFIIYGMNEEGGLAIALPGVPSANTDAEILRLENSIRDGVQPRIPGVSTRYIRLANGNYSFVIFIPQSWAGPHMVTYKNLSRFFSRNSAGKFQLDVQEIRQSFLLNDSINEKIKSFRLDRLAKIVAGDTPVPMDEGAKVILHIIPVMSFQTNFLLNLKAVYGNLYQVGTLSGPTNSTRYNLDGIVTSTSMQEGQPVSYVQLFRNGVMESVDSFILKGHRTLTKYIPHKYFEGKLIEVCPKLLRFQELLGVNFPIAIFLSLSGVKDYSLMTKEERIFRVPEYTQFMAKIDRDILLLPEVIIETIENMNYGKLLRPVFDAVWNAAGLPESSNYDKDGNWLNK